jgi:hypothetical protein
MHLSLHIVMRAGTDPLMEGALLSARISQQETLQSQTLLAGSISARIKRCSRRFTGYYNMLASVWAGKQRVLIAAISNHAIR